MTDGQRFTDFARIGVDWLWETDSQDRFTYFSVENSRSGVELQSRVGLRRRDGATPEPDNLARIATLEEMVARREPFRDFIYHAGAGSSAQPRWYSISGEPRYGTDNEFLGYLGVGRDVTARIEAEKALESQSRTLEVILRAIPDGVLLIDKKHATLAVNDRVYEILGVPIPKDRPDGDSAIQLLVDLAERGEYGAGDPEKLARERADGMVSMVAARQNIIYRRQLKTGRWMEARISALDDGGFLWLYRDITEAREREAELERQAALLSTIVANMDGGISVFDKDGRLAVWNDRFADLTGVDPARVRHGAAVRDLLVAQACAGEFGPCDPEAEADHRLALFHADRPVVNERLRPNGRIVELRRSPMPGGGSVTIYIDVTARRQAEQAVQDLNTTLERRIAERTAALAESERSQRAVIANVPGMVYRCRNDRDWTMLFVSEGCRDLLGIAPDELTSGRVVYNELIDQHEREAVWLKTQVNLDAGQALGVEYRVRHADGTWRWVWDRARAIRSASGDITALEGLILDVTARKAAEQELVRARDSLTDALESLDHNMILWDRDDRLVLFTRHLYDQYPSADEYFKVGRTFAEILRAAAEGGAFVAPPGQTKEQFAAERIAHHKAVDGTVLTRHLPNGRVLHISEHRAPSGGIVSVGRDVTELLKIEEQLREAHRMDAIGRLTGGLAHDLNNYLAVVIGNLDMLGAHKHLDPEVPTLIAGAVAGALRGAELTSSLLAFSRRQSLDPRVTDVGQRVGEVAKLVGHTIGKNITIKVSRSAGLWPVKIDRVQLDVCIANLINNARDAMPDGGMLSISMRNATPDDEHAPPGDYVLIELADTGIGMSAETLARIFEPFFTTKGPRHGAGLGLSMVHGFVHQSGGVIDVATRPGEGTTVRIFLARAVEADPVQAARRKASTLPGGSERILLVEDDDQVRAVAVEQLTSLGYSVVETENGDTAVMLLENKGDEFDLVFTDMIMPGGIDGFELAQLVLERWPGKKVLLTSGFSGGVGDDLEEQANGIIVLRKPYRKADLARAVRVALLT